MTLPVKTKVINCTPRELLGRPLNDIERKCRSPTTVCREQQANPVAWSALCDSGITESLDGRD